MNTINLSSILFIFNTKSLFISFYVSQLLSKNFKQRAGDAYARNKGLHYQSARQVQKVKTGLVKKKFALILPHFLSKHER